MRDVLAGAALSPQRNNPLGIGWSVALGLGRDERSAHAYPALGLIALTQRDRTIQRSRGWVRLPPVTDCAISSRPAASTGILMDFIRPPANLTRRPEKEAQRDGARALKWAE